MGEVVLHGRRLQGVGQREGYHAHHQHDGGHELDFLGGPLRHQRGQDVGQVVVQHPIQPQRGAQHQVQQAGHGAAPLLVEGGVAQAVAVQGGEVGGELGAGGPQALGKSLLGPGQGLQQRAAQLEVVVERIGVVVGVEMVAERALDGLHQGIVSGVLAHHKAALQRLTDGGGELLGGGVGVLGVGGGVVGHHNGRGHVQQHVGAEAGGVEVVDGHRHHPQPQLEMVAGLGAEGDAGGAGFQGPQAALAHAGALGKNHDGAAAAQVVVAAAESGLVLGGAHLG